MTYDNRTSASLHWDPSILGIDEDDMARMDEEERARFLEGALHEVGDRAEAILRAFHPVLNAEQQRTILQAARALQGLARKM